MNKLICYVTGGLGNRILPIASFMEFAKKTNRELYIYWPLDFRCKGSFSDYYSDKLTFVDDNFLWSLPVENTQVLCLFPDGVSNDYLIYDRTFLWKSREAGNLIYGEPTLDNKVENVVCCTNTFLSAISQEDNEAALKNLQIKEDIIKDADDIAATLGLSKNILGIHLRGTDYNLSPQHYAEMIGSELPSYSFNNIFICSDDEDYEVWIENLYPMAIRRKGKIYITKENDAFIGGWLHNTDTSAESLRDALIDIILLSKTNFKIYNITSTFAQYAEVLSHE
jgi:hypothetical protein